MGRTWLLTGRSEELRFIAAAMRPAHGSAGVVLAGAAGVGKTRLAREALTAAEQEGARSRWVSATQSSRQVPFGAFAGLVGEISSDPTRVLREAAHRLTVDAGSAGVVVGVDDAHLLDELSALLVHHLVLHNIATVVATVRTGQRAPDAVTALWKDGYLGRLEVQPLSEPETAELLEAVVGGPVDRSAARRIWARTGGNPLYLRVLVDGELEAGRLREVSGVWRWDDNQSLSVALAELVESRIGAVPAAVGQVLDVLAMCEPLEVKVLTQLSDAAAIEQAELLGAVSVESDGRRLQARLAHPLYGDVRRARMGVIRQRRLRGRIASALSDQGEQGPDDLLRRAVLAVDSDLAPDADFLTSAARQSARLLDLPLAERLAGAAVAAGGGFEARLAFAYAVAFQSRGAEAEAEMRVLAESAASNAERAAAARIRAGNLFFTLRRPREAEAVLADAAATLPGDSTGRSLNAMRAAFDAYLARPTAAIRAAGEALGSERVDDQTVVLASYGLVTALGYVGQPDEMEEAFARGYDASKRSFDAAWLRYGLLQLYLVGLHLAGRLSEAHHVARDCYEDSHDLHGRPQLAAVLMLGHTALARGKLCTAIRFLREARAGLLTVESAGFDYFCLLNLTQALAKTGDPSARRSLTELEDNVHPAFTFLEPELVLTRAWVAAGEGAVSEAIALTNVAATIAASRGQLAHEVLARHTAVCFGDDTVVDRLSELAAKVGGPRAPAAAAHARALAAGDGGALHAASKQLEEIGDLVAAADAAAQAATAHARDGRRGSAHVAAARAQHLADACEGARTPAVIATARPLPLTHREREIATLAAQGLSNRQIAQRLVVSIRTVEGHLYRAQAKLGITSRTELGAVLKGE